MWVLLMRTLVTRTSVRVHNSFVRFSPVDTGMVPVSLLLLGLLVLPARAGAQTASQAFINLFSGARLYVDPASAAKRQADAWRRSRPSDAELMDRIASQPVAQWLAVGTWTSAVTLPTQYRESPGRERSPFLSPTTFPVVTADSTRRAAPTGATHTRVGFAVLPMDLAIAGQWSFWSPTRWPE
jgi:hypothetical protein